MSGFLRPEAAATLRRWREVLVALGLVALGLWIAARPGPIIQGFGYVLAGLSVIALLPAIRRARFVAGTEGPGVVQVVEGRILYMGPLTGGAISLADMTTLALHTEIGPSGSWVLSDPGHILEIPVDAAGAEALFDAFTALPGFSMQRLLAAQQTMQPGTHVLWRRDTPPALTE